MSIIEHLLKNDLINEEQHHHLLGCYRPQEFSDYSQFSFLLSLDSSNPVIHGYYGDLYTEHGLDFKRRENIDTIIDKYLTEKQIENIYFNVLKFKDFLNGN